MYMYMGYNITCMPKGIIKLMINNVYEQCENKKEQNKAIHVYTG